VLILDAGRVDWRTRWGETAWIHLLGGNDVGVTVGLLLGRRSCTVGVVGLAIARVQTVCSGGGSSIRLMKGLKGALLCWLLAWTVMLSAISSSSSSGVLSSKITNGLLLRVCR
jgi:hypothetical protein